MADSKKPSGSKRIIDVAHPDATAPSGNSKSVIVSNRPLLQDPMVVDGEKAAGTAAGTPADKADKPPLAVNAKPPALKSALTAEPKPTGTPDAKPAAADTAKPDAAKPDADASEADKKTEEESTEKAPPTANENAEQAAAEAEVEAKQHALVDKLAESKKYYLPIDTVEKRRSRRFVAAGILLSLLLIIAWADIALDAGLIHLSNVKPVTHFFSN